MTKDHASPSLGPVAILSRVWLRTIRSLVAERWWLSVSYIITSLGDTDWWQRHGSQSRTSLENWIELQLVWKQSAATATAVTQACRSDLLRAGHNFTCLQEEGTAADFTLQSTYWSPSTLPFYSRMLSSTACPSPWWTTWELSDRYGIMSVCRSLSGNSKLEQVLTIILVVVLYIETKVKVMNSIREQNQNNHFLIDLKYSIIIPNFIIEERSNSKSPGMEEWKSCRILLFGNLLFPGGFV